MSDQAIMIDHVILAVPSLDAALEKLKRDHDLVGIPTPPDDGPIQTAIIPFERDQYLEVLALKESKVVEGPLADFAEQLRVNGAFFWGFAVRTMDLKSVAKRVGIPASTVVGRSVQSKTVRPPANEANQLPFFIEYLNGTGDAYLERIRRELLYAASRLQGVRFSRIALSTDRLKLTEWLGTELAELDVVDGASGIVSIEIETRDGRSRLV